MVEAGLVMMVEAEEEAEVVSGNGNSDGNGGGGGRGGNGGRNGGRCGAGGRGGNGNAGGGGRGGNSRRGGSIDHGGNGGGVEAEVVIFYKELLNMSMIESKMFFVNKECSNPDSVKVGVPKRYVLNPSFF